MGYRRQHAGRDEDTKELILFTQTGFGRISHWTWTLLLSLVILSGLYMTHPFLPLFPMRIARFTHLSMSGILAALLVARFYFALVTGDIRNFLFHRGDLKNFFKLMAYYFFLSREMPYEPTKYNVGQRLIYNSWALGWIFQCVTGLILANPTDPRSLMLSHFFGGLQIIRFARYLVTVYFVATILVHIYLSLTSDPAKLQAIFTGYVRVKDGKPED